MEKFTLNTYETDKYLTHAITIGDYVVSSAFQLEESCYWEVFNNKGIKEVNINLYNGNAGIIHFLIELYKTTKNKLLLPTIIRGCNYLVEYKYNEKEKNINYYSGLGGIIIVLLEAYKITGIEEYKKRSLNIGFDCKELYQNKSFDLLSGNAGCILTLLKMLEQSKEDWIIESIYKHIYELINNIIVYKTGICWNRTGYTIHPLCGFAHGASGIAFIFLELYRHFNDDIFYEIAELAFEYEDQYFQPSAIKNKIFSENNWPDFRKDSIMPDGFEKLKVALLSDDLDSLNTPEFMSAWCHGAPGIGLARLLAYNIRKDNKHLFYFSKATENAMKSIAYKMNGNYTLCHGILGNASIALEGYIILGDEEYYKMACKVADEYLQDKRINFFSTSGYIQIKKKADCGFFMGLSGIGHFFLRLYSPHTVSSILSPYIKELKNEKTSSKIYDKKSFINLMFRKIFTNSSTFLKSAELKFLNNITKITREEIVNSTRITIKQINNIDLNNLLSIDNIILKISDKIENDLYLYIKRSIDQDLLKAEYANINTHVDIFGKNLCLSPFVNLIHKKNRNGFTYILLHTTCDGVPVRQYILHKFSFQLLKSFKKNTDVNISYKKMSKAFKYLDVYFNKFDYFYCFHLVNSLNLGFLMFT